MDYSHSVENRLLLPMNSNSPNMLLRSPSLQWSELDTQAKKWGPQAQKISVMAGSMALQIGLVGGGHHERHQLLKERPCDIY